MEIDKLIPLHHFCEHHNIENSFIITLNEHDLVKIYIIEGKPFLHHDSIEGLEKIIRLYLDLEINFEGIDVILKLLCRIDELQQELNLTKQKLKEFEMELNEIEEIIL